jgi:hypothetical protein
LSDVPSGTISYSTLESADFLGAVFSQTQTGTDRYGLLEHFVDVSDASSGNTPGKMNFSAFGQPFVDFGFALPAYLVAKDIAVLMGLGGLGLWAVNGAPVPNIRVPDLTLPEFTLPPSPAPAPGARLFDPNIVDPLQPGMVFGPGQTARPPLELDPIRDFHRLLQMPGSTRFDPALVPAVIATVAQERAISRIENTIRDHLTENDIAGALADLTGNPVPRAGGGFWNHAQEVNEAIRGLRNQLRILDGVNTPEANAARQAALNAIQRVEAALRGAGL